MKKLQVQPFRIIFQIQLKFWGKSVVLDSSNFILAREQNSPIPPVGIGGHVFGSPFEVGADLQHLDVGSSNEPIVLVSHKASDALLGLLNVGDEAVDVVVPLDEEALSGWVLATGYLDGQLHGVGEVVVEVLHASPHLVPIGTVGDAVPEIAPELALVGRVLHVGMVFGVGLGQVEELLVIWSLGNSRWFYVVGGGPWEKAVPYL